MPTKSGRLFLCALAAATSIGVRAARAAEVLTRDCPYAPSAPTPKKSLDEVLAKEAGGAEAGDVKSMFDIGLAAYGSRRYDIAIPWYVKAAAKGSTGALVNLGVAYASGNGVDRDVVEAVKLYQMAAKAGDAQAMANLGSLELDGTGLPRDTSGGILLLRRAADLGNDNARVSIGKLYRAGEVLPKEPGTAFDLFCKAAQQHNVNALDAMGTFFAFPSEGAADWVQALVWYRRGADLGGGASMMEIGWAYENGLGIKQDPTEAFRFYKLSAQADATFGILNVARSYYEGVGTPVDMRMAKAWFEKAAAKGSTEAQNVLRTNFKVVHTPSPTPPSEAAVGKPAPSFPCEAAKTLDEKAICSDAKLSELDVLRARDYQTQRRQDPKQALADAREFRAARYRCGNDRVCLVDVMRYLPSGAASPDWIDGYRAKLVTEVAREDLSPRSYALIGRRGTFPLSAKGVQATLARISGVDTDHALATGMVTHDDDLEYCERDPGGDTVAHGGRLTVAQCASRQSRGRESTSRADCKSGRLMLWDGNWQFVRSANGSITWMNPRRQIEEPWNGTATADAQYELLCPSEFAKARVSANAE